MAVSLYYRVNLSQLHSRYFNQPGTIDAVSAGVAHRPRARKKQGNFGLPIVLRNGRDSMAVAAVDFNGDGMADIITTAGRRDGEAGCLDVPGVDALCQRVPGCG